MTSYATLADLRARLNPPDTSRDAMLTDLLAGASRYIDGRVGFDFLSHGPETRTFDVPPTPLTPPIYGTYGVMARFPIYGGVQSLSLAEVAPGTGSSFGDLAGTDWYLWPRQLEPEGTYTHLTMLATGQYGRLPPGQGVLRLTGLFGWAAPPTIVREAVLAHAGRSYHEWQTKQAGIVGNPDTGTIALSPNAPEIVYRAIEQYRRYWWSGI